MFMLGLDNKKACVRVRLLMRPGQRHYYLAFICQLICDVIMSRSAVESTLSLPCSHQWTTFVQTQRIILILCGTNFTGRQIRSKFDSSVTLLKQKLIVKNTAACSYFTVSKQTISYEFVHPFPGMYTVRLKTKIILLDMVNFNYSIE